jgi:hypothetical protein
MQQLHRRGNRENRRGGRRRLGYANVVSTLALVLAIGGGTAWAAHHYLITSTSQIKPSVLAKLHGARGPAGAQGNAGAQGAAGAAGASGASGAAGAAGAPGQNGSVAAYYATASLVNIPIGANSGNFATMVSKSLPAGHYVIYAQTDTEAGTTAAPAGAYQGVENTCELTEGGSVEATTQTDSGIVESTTPFGPIFQEETTMHVQAALTLSSTQTIALQCQVNVPDQTRQGDVTGFFDDGSNSALTATQTSAIS